MEVDEATPHEASAKVRRKKRKTTCAKRWQSVRRKQMRLAVCQVLQVNLEDPFCPEPFFTEDLNVI